ncbi:MAG: hypothetical protein QOG67_1690 [Verrucomicrobiota bacterium]|jgi:hypothetical protein
MKLIPRASERANVLIGVLCTITILSMIAANVLLNCSTRFNAATSQVRAWKESLYAAEAGGDIAYAEVRKTIFDPENAFSDWSNAGGIHSKLGVTFGAHNLNTNTKVDLFYYDSFTGNPWYRIRANGTAPVQGLKRVGMDDRMGVGTRGDSLLRKIDFNYDHFIATYGPNGDGSGKASVAVSRPQMTRRIELVAAPITPFEAAIKCSGSFYGLGSAAQIDSFNSKNGAYYFAANNPADPHYGDSRSGSVEIGSSVATIMGMLYGNVATNGGSIVRSNQITGTIDNNVPITIPPFYMPTTMPVPQANPTRCTGTTTIAPPTAGSPSNPNFYLFSSFTGDLTIQPYGVTETYVAIHVTSDITGKIDIKPYVHVQVFFDGNLSMKAKELTNETGIAGNMQFYGISPSNSATTQSIDINPPGNFQATFYAPSANFSMNGNPDVIGAVVCKTFYGNGNTSWHYDRALDSMGDAVDYRIASYVEDTR